MTAEPAGGSRAVSELRLGDGFALLDESGGWAWGYSLDDHYVGYVPASALGHDAAPTHFIKARTALVFAAPDIKAPVTGTLPIGARVAGEFEGDFLRVDDGFLHHRHVRALGEWHQDPAAVATKLLGTPYRWGGRSGFGIDCSGLIQLALGLSGLVVPRDSDQQRDSIGQPIADSETLQRNDIVFFPGHVGLMLDERSIIHANAHAMVVSVEDLEAVVARGSAIVARRRLTL
ncbi:NlpC/P60 family protein [Sphingomonas jatrophae]|uniref:NlpC/P60 family protein n=2 Tax=Sphingomonas jatrophae TaxID=1166337 RepID=A0A1I6JJV8_9SPHN|nr:NlpC/P60 family protein [Sphingomonas jatrophae]